LNREDPLFQKLWRVAAIQGHHNPWHPDLLGLVEAQLDLILEQYAIDHPKELRFERRKSRREKERPLETLKGWADVLMGRARADLLGRVAFKIPARFQTSGPFRLAPNAIPPATKPPALPAPHAAPATVPRPAPRRRK
jgi:hypothetical protein